MFNKIKSSPLSGNKTSQSILSPKTEAVDLNRLENEIIMLNQKISNLEQELIYSRNELGQFASNVAHDLKQSVYISSTFLSLLESEYKTKLDEKALEYIHFAQSGSQQAHTLLTGLSVFVQSDTPGAFELINFEAAIQRAAANLDSLIKKSGAEITCGSLPQLWGNRLQMIRLFENFISNFIQYCGTNTPKVHVSAKDNDENWIFKIQDNGIGFDQRYKEIIFNIFQKINKEQVSKAGVGLTICKRIVERHNGKIWAESELGKGAAFYFSLSKKLNRNSRPVKNAPLL